MSTTLLSRSLDSALANLPSDIASSIRSQVETISSDDQMKLENYFQSDNDLNMAYQMIGETAGQGLWGIDAIREGKRIFQNYSVKLQGAVCGNANVRAYCENAAVIDYVAAAAIVVGALLPFQTKFGNIDIVSASVILSRRGLLAFCETEWKNPAAK